MPPAPFPAPPTAFNRCNVPPWALSAREFQAHPRPVEIDGVRRTDRRLFERLATITSAAERARIFHEYLSVKFSLHEWAEQRTGPARSSLRHSYVQFLQAWGADSNGHAGAVLKSWVESRFGLVPTYHGGILAQDADARQRYRLDQVKGAAKTVAVAMQLDLLYTFCQDELRRLHADHDALTLYRGTHDPEEYAVADETPASADETVVEFNNLSSFTADPEVAWEFGSHVWSARVPLAKIVFFSGLLPPHLLGGEAEFLVLGGRFAVRRLRY